MARSRSLNAIADWLRSALTKPYMKVSAVEIGDRLTASDPGMGDRLQKMGLAEADGGVKEQGRRRRTPARPTICAPATARARLARPAMKVAKVSRRSSGDPSCAFASPSDQRFDANCDSCVVLLAAAAVAADFASARRTRAWLARPHMNFHGDDALEFAGERGEQLLLIVRFDPALQEARGDRESRASGDELLQAQAAEPAVEDIFAEPDAKSFGGAPPYVFDRDRGGFQGGAQGTFRAHELAPSSDGRMRYVMERSRRISRTAGCRGVVTPRSGRLASYKRRFSSPYSVRRAVFPIRRSRTEYVGPEIAP